ncbi:MAG: hypothetical protein J6M39_02840 [Lachnospiraceae bacterium]|nr:hypothetical protein [Lachnospiraceae bacterium]
MSILNLVNGKNVKITNIAGIKLGSTCKTIGERIPSTKIKNTMVEIYLGYLW